MAKKKSYRRESGFQGDVIRELKSRFEGSVVMKTNPNYIQGIPDLIILHKDKWAALEVKRSRSASKRPNQKYYINKMNEMSYASFIYPENKEEVLNDIQRAFGI